MKIIPDIVSMQDEMVKWRRDIHSHPEVAFNESRTSDFVASQLESFGLEVTRGIGGTGVVGTLRLGSSTKTIGLRADMDALSIDELNDFAHKSKLPGVMHACGHDGHTVMLLAAASYLAQSKRCNGTVNFIFQPAEEANDIGSGAKAMIDDGLFERFPVDNVFALHNAPDFCMGAIATRSGPMTASSDYFEVIITGLGAHAAFPHESNDPIMIAIQMIMSWQTIVSRNINAHDSAVVSVTGINTSDSGNVIPGEVFIKGTVRTFSEHNRQLVQDRFCQLTNGIAEGFGVSVQVNYQSRSPSCVNDKNQTTFACDVAASIFGENKVLRDMPPDMGSEDFGYMLRERPGCYLIIGSAKSSFGQDGLKDLNVNVEEDQEYFIFKDASLLHQPDYDFNDEIIPLGATLFVRLAESYLGSHR